MAVISIIGLYRIQPKLFDLIQLPMNVNRELLIDNLVTDLAEMEVIYPDPDIMREMIGRWSSKQIKVWNRLNDLFDAEYNPIWNVDGTEKEVETHDLHAAGSIKRSGEETGSVTGYNSDQLRTSDRLESEAATQSTGSDTGTIIREKTRGGNIGVTMTQQMIEAELDTRPKLNIYSYIIEDFKSRFCLLVY